MGGDSTELSGPDLGAGIAESELADGSMLAGHAGGEAVLLVRQGGSFFAVGAHCTHYGAPLADGIVVDGAVHCPWHHARFDLKTGAAIAAPALNPIGCWTVEHSGGRVRVIGRKGEPPRGTAPRGAPGRIVIIGAGAAGNAAAEELRQLGFDGELTLIGAESDGPYDRPNLSKDYLAGNAPEEWIPLRSHEFYAGKGITLRLEQAVSRIDAARREVVFGDGTVLGYDRLLLATGAEPVRLKVPTEDGAPVHYLRSLADSRRIIAALPGAARAVVIGASFIGLEVAAALRQRGLAVAVVAPETVPFEKVLGPELGQYIKALHESRGVEFHLGAGIERIMAKGVHLSNGADLAADLIVVGVGVRPLTALAESAGAALDRGVVVNDRLETSVPGIYAAGDIARVPDPRTGKPMRVEHWVVAERQGQAAARNMLGLDAPYRDVPFFWSAHYDTTINYTGHADAWDRAELAGDLGAASAIVSYWQDGQVAAVATIGRDTDALRAEVAMERNDNAALTALMRH